VAEVANANVSTEMKRGIIEYLLVSAAIVPWHSANWQSLHPARRTHGVATRAPVLAQSCHPSAARPLTYTVGESA
jgi:hypothetical protein